jgi:hypothetical protein
VQTAWRWGSRWSIQCRRRGDGAVGGVEGDASDSAEEGVSDTIDDVELVGIRAGAEDGPTGGAEDRAMARS